ncbi:DUF3606 domain-containing protein (plasmid) [Ensifer adhaerens]|uniref:DUF3606 domain-containing protein n=1 Tax=Ensifer adhaerens TaxID=106592 RepID=UPI001CBF1732|nr:DUF3606 domain-containing protein [Ensifer adhaerens]MBZ7927677.1 DUF3606 domain-containing protein [Ensifer adhaerens]UAX98073.1 DUF3606 domain-containing protein [Ensifer adhaerens]UAY05454.1 DUF3606 domain-containing protein [Ensifer adhaerens]UAY12832.1 DUF3606 domain-containing protein [Ensifer adhaerens]
MVDDPKKQGRDRQFVSTQEHEVAYIMKTAKVIRQKALEAIRIASPARDKVLAHLRGKEGSP